MSTATPVTINPSPASDRHFTPPPETEVLRRLEAKMEQQPAAAPPDAVNHPPHYQGHNGIECIDALEAMGVAEDFCRGNAVKYLWRLGKKDESLRELKKAKWYLDRLIQIMESKQSQ